MLESQLIKGMQMSVKVTKASGSRPIVLYKNHGSGMGNNGRPDLELMYRGRLVLIEAKVDRGELSRLQHVEHDRLRAAGMDVRIVRTVSEFNEILMEIEGDEEKRIDSRCTIPECRWCARTKS